MPSIKCVVRCNTLVPIVANSKCHVTRKTGNLNPAVLYNQLLYVMTDEERTIHMGIMTVADGLYRLEEDNVFGDGRGVIGVIGTDL